MELEDIEWETIYDGQAARMAQLVTVPCPSCNGKECPKCEGKGTLHGCRLCTNAPCFCNKRRGKEYECTRCDGKGALHSRGPRGLCACSKDHAKEHECHTCKGKGTLYSCGHDRPAGLKLCANCHILHCYECLRKCYADYLWSDEWKQKRQETFERDGWKCVDCKRTIKEVRLEASHIHGSYDAYFEDRSIDHLQTRCVECHRRYDGRCLQCAGYWDWNDKQGYCRACKPVPPKPKSPKPKLHKPRETAKQKRIRLERNKTKPKRGLRFKARDNGETYIITSIRNGLVYSTQNVQAYEGGDHNYTDWFSLASWKKHVDYWVAKEEMENNNGSTN